MQGIICQIVRGGYGTRHLNCFYGPPLTVGRGGANQKFPTGPLEAPGTDSPLGFRVLRMGQNRPPRGFFEASSREGRSIRYDGSNPSPPPRQIPRFYNANLELAKELLCRYRFTIRGL